MKKKRKEKGLYNRTNRTSSRSRWLIVVLALMFTIHLSRTKLRNVNSVCSMTLKIEALLRVSENKNKSGLKTREANLKRKWETKGENLKINKQNRRLKLKEKKVNLNLMKVLSDKIVPLTKVLWFKIKNNSLETWNLSNRWKNLPKLAKDTKNEVQTRISMTQMDSNNIPRNKKWP